MELKGKVAVVTGAASGIGKAAAARFAKEGAAGVVLADLSYAKTKDAASEVGGHAVECDVTSEKEVQRLVREAEERFGRVDVFFSNAGIFRRGGLVPMKPVADEALAQAPTVTQVLVVKRAGNPVEMRGGRDRWWHDLVPKQTQFAKMEPTSAEDPLMIIYTSGTTGRPKGTCSTRTCSRGYSRRSRAGRRESSCGGNGFRAIGQSVFLLDFGPTPGSNPPAGRARPGPAQHVSRRPPQAGPLPYAGALEGIGRPSDEFSHVSRS